MASQEGQVDNHLHHRTPREFATARRLPNHDQPSSTLPNTVYVVVDTCYPKESDFNQGKGVTAVFSVHSSIAAANAKAKKIMFANEGGCTVDVDKVIEETRHGLYTGIGIGGQEERADHCYARKWVGPHSRHLCMDTRANIAYLAQV